MAMTYWSISSAMQLANWHEMGWFRYPLTHIIKTHY
jgi:hypothetical protein